MTIIWQPGDNTHQRNRDLPAKSSDFFKRVDAIIICFDLTNVESFQHVSNKVFYWQCQWSWLLLSGYRCFKKVVTEKYHFNWLDWKQTKEIHLLRGWNRGTFSCALISQCLKNRSSTSFCCFWISFPEVAKCDTECGYILFGSNYHF